MRGWLGLLLLVVVACGGGSGSGSGSTGSSGTTPSATSEGDPASSCFGEQSDPSRFYNVGSCAAQEGEWVNYGANGSSYCRVVPGWKCDRHAGDQEACVRVIGCSFKTTSGAVVKNTNVGGRCEGTPRACEEYTDVEQCYRAWGCESLDGEKCTKRSESELGPHTCEELTGIDGSGWHPDEAYRLCGEREGCTWKAR